MKYNQQTIGAFVSFFGFFSTFPIIRDNYSIENTGDSQMKITTKTVLLTLLLFLPTFAAIAYFAVVQSAPVTDGAVYRMLISDIDGNEFDIKRGEESENLPAAEFKLPSGKSGDIISFFCEMNEKAKSISELPSPLVGTPAFNVTYYSYNLENKYKYYFSVESSDAYFTDSAGVAYQITGEYSAAFITTQFALCLYKDANAPVLTLSNNHVVKPSNMEWKYRRSDSMWGDAVVELAPTRGTYPVSGMLNLSFDIMPDQFNVRILDGETELYDGNYDELPQNFFKENKQLNVSVLAKWYELDDLDYNGSASYNFIADVTAPAEFYLGQSEIYPGEFVAITGINVKNPKDIEFISTPEIDFTPVFFTDLSQGSDCVVALVPISFMLDYSPSYTFEILYGDAKTTITLNVASKVFKWRDYDVSPEIIAMTRTEHSINAFNDTMAQYFNHEETTRYWNPGEKWLLPSSSDVVQTGIGIYRTLTATGHQYRHQGIDFTLKEGSEIFASGAGKVIFVGAPTLSGRTVVIDHGFGLKTLYAHMNSTSVSEGEEVSAGTVLGIAGNTGFTKGTGLHFGMYIFDTPVSPYCMWFWPTDSNSETDLGIQLTW